MPKPDLGLLKAQLDQHDLWTRLHRAHNENLQAWEDASPEEREAYSQSLIDHPGMDPTRRQLGKEQTPLGFAAWRARRQLEQGGPGPWIDEAHRQLDESPETLEDVLAQMQPPEADD